MATTGLASKKMFRQTHIVAFVLIASVLGGSQCAEFCTILSCDRPSPTSHATEHTAPCHQSKSPEQPTPPASKSCAHQEFVAEKRSDASTPDQMQAPPLFFDEVPAALAPVWFQSQLAIDTEHSPSSNRLGRISVLRI